MANKKPTYIKGSAREVIFEDGSSLINFSMNKEQLMELIDVKGYLQFTMRANKNGKDDYNNTHHVILNEFVPDKSKAGIKSPAKPSKGGDGDDLPF